jgi:hypothetical protein
MGFLNYNIIFDIDISNYETDYTKIRHDFWSRGVVQVNGGQLKVDFGLFCRIYVVKGKEISIFLHIWTRKYVYLWNLTCTYADNELEMNNNK